jgi:hypothetical protein
MQGLKTCRFIPILMEGTAWFRPAIQGDLALLGRKIRKNAPVRTKNVKSYLSARALHG